MTTHADPRRQQQAAAALCHLLADTEYLDTSEQWDAASELAEAAHHGEPLLADGRLGAWKHSWDQGVRQALPVHDLERGVGDRLARAALAASGHLKGPTLHLPSGLELRAGDQVLIQPGNGSEFVLTDHGDRLDRGAPGTVTAVDADQRTFDLHVATVGCTHTLRAESQIGTALTYAYTTEADPTVDLTYAEARPAERQADRSAGVSL